MRKGGGQLKKRSPFSSPNKTKIFRPLTRSTPVEETATNEKKGGVFSYLTPRGRAESVRSSSRWTASEGFISRSRSDGYNEDLIFSGASNSNPTAMDDRGRTPRSRRDRAAIAARSSRDRGEDGAGPERNRLPSIAKRSTKLEQYD